MQYRVFIGSPGNLNKERIGFRDVIAKFNRDLAESEGMTFSAIGWEETLAGQGRPQAIINDELKTCDYAVFVLHDKWGTPTGNESSGTHEEWKLACELHQSKKIRKIFLAFKRPPKIKLNDPGDDLKKVLAFRAGIMAERAHLFADFGSTSEFCDAVRAHLSDWYRDHKGTSTESVTDSPAEQNRVLGAEDRAASPSTTRPSFEFWLAETDNLLSANEKNPSAALFCAQQALKAAEDLLEILQAKSAIASTKYLLDDLFGALQGYEEVVRAIGDANDRAVPSHMAAQWMFNRCATLAMLDRHKELPPLYRNIIERFQTTTDIRTLRLIAKSKVNLAYSVAKLGDVPGAINLGLEVANTYFETTDSDLSEQVDLALFNVAIDLRNSGQIADTIEQYKKIIDRAGPTYPKRDVREARALLNLGYAFGEMKRVEEELTTYQRLIDTYRASSSTEVRTQVGNALINTGYALGLLGKSDEELARYDDAYSLLEKDEDPKLREVVGRALINKGVELESVGRLSDARATMDLIISRFESSGESVEPEYVTKAKSWITTHQG